MEFKVDNIAVVHVLQSTYCKEPHLMHLVCLLIFFAAYHNFWFSASRIAGELNTGADALPRNNLLLFLSKIPRAAQNPAFIPPQLILLLTQNITWTCTDGAVQHYFTSALAHHYIVTYSRLMPALVDQLCFTVNMLCCSLLS